MTDAPAQPVALPAERVGHGLLFALIVVPVGVIAWVLIWSIGVFSSLIAFGVAIAAVWLYRRGSGGRISMRGVAVIAAVVVVTLTLGFFGGLLWDAASIYAAELGGNQLDALQHSGFDNFLSAVSALLWKENGLNALLALLFGVLGAYGSIRGAVREARAGTDS